MKRETLQADRTRVRKEAPLTDSGLITVTKSRQLSLIDSHLEALDLIDGGTKAANRTAEVRKAIADVREKLLAGEVAKAQFMLGVIMREMLSSDYRRYPTWKDQQPRIDEEFGDLGQQYIEKARRPRDFTPEDKAVLHSLIAKKYCPECGNERALGDRCRACGNVL